MMLKSLSRPIVALAAVISLAGCMVMARGLSVDEARTLMPKTIAQPLIARVYRQYTMGNEYLQFERAENNILYGFRTCTTGCAYSRVPFVSVYDGNYLYITFGRHEDLYVSTDGSHSVLANPTTSLADNMELSSMHRFTVEGRNIVVNAVAYTCSHDGLQWRTSPAFVNETQRLCDTARVQPLSGVWVATTDEVLTGGDHLASSAVPPTSAAPPERVAPPVTAAQIAAMQSAESPVATSATPSSSSCDRSSEPSGACVTDLGTPAMVCVEYFGQADELMQQKCALNSGRFFKGRCVNPPAGNGAYCVRDRADGTGARSYFYQPSTLDKLAAICASMAGVWCPT